MAYCEDKLMKVWFFTSCMISLFGLVMALFEYDYDFTVGDVIRGWVIFSVPLIITLIYMVCFPRKRDE